MQGALAERIKEVFFNILTYREEISNPAGSKHFVKINVS